MELANVIVDNAKVFVVSVSATTITLSNTFSASNDVVIVFRAYGTGLIKSIFGIEVEFIRHYFNGKIHGLFGYFYSFLKSLLSYKPPFFDINIKNENISVVPHLLMIANTNKQGYGISLSPNAKTDDGYLNLIMINNTNMFNISYLLVLILLGISIKNKNNVRYINFKEFKITSKNYHINLQIDGEYRFIIKNELCVSIISDGINILC